MRILATVKIGKMQTTQAWELLPGSDGPGANDFLKVADLPDKKELVIKLDRHKIMDLKGAELAGKHYPGILEITDAFTIPSN
jgi:hypothetical protein